MTSIFISDLDGTLIYSQARTPDVQHARVVEATDGGHLSYIHRDGWTLLQRMAGDNTLIPATTRTTDEFNRLQLPTFNATIVANGGVVLFGGVPDPHWRAWVLGSSDTDLLGYAHEEFRKMTAAPGTQTIRLQEQLFLTVTTRSGHATPDGFDDAARMFASSIGYVVSRQGRKLYVTPAWLTKEAAAVYVTDHLGADSTFAAGDSTLDAGLLTWADEAMHPQHAIDPLPGVATKASGIDAGLELLTWAHAHTQSS